MERMLTGAENGQKSRWQQRSVRFWTEPPEPELAGHTQLSGLLRASVGLEL